MISAKDLRILPRHRIEQSLDGRLRGLRFLDSLDLVSGDEKKPRFRRGFPLARFAPMLRAQPFSQLAGGR